MPALFFFICYQLAHLAPYVHPNTSKIIIVVASFIAFSQSNSKYFERISEIVTIDGWAEHYPYKGISDLREQLDRLGTDSSLIFVGYLPEPNHSLIYAGRHGAVFNSEEMNRPKSPIYHYISIIKPNFFVIPTSEKNAFEEKHSSLLRRMEVQYKNEHYIIYLIHGY